MYVSPWFVPKKVDWTFKYSQFSKIFDRNRWVKSSSSYPFPTPSGIGTTCFSSCCDKHSAIIFTTGRLSDINRLPDVSVENRYTKLNKLFKILDLFNLFWRLCTYSSVGIKVCRCRINSKFLNWVVEYTA
jgi:hypothetical protein